jgi:lysyl-tRNA synthetase class 2
MKIKIMKIKSSKEIREMLLIRHEVLKSLRGFFFHEGFIEIETPYLLKCNTPDPYIDPLIVLAQGTDLKERFQLPTSPEIWLKKALGAGLPKIFQLAKAFRDDPKTRSHRKEFTMLEWYRKDANLLDLTKDCEQIFSITARALGADLGYLHNPIHYDLPDLFLACLNIDLSYVLEAMAWGDSYILPRLLAEKGDHLPENSGFSEAFSHIMAKYIEASLPKDRASFIHRWPSNMAALSAPCPDDTRYCQRFEIYFAGLEIANAYQECANIKTLSDRFHEENQTRLKLNKEAFPIDNQLLSALSDIPQAAGIALGLDRLIMTLLKKTSIDDVVFC